MRKNIIISISLALVVFIGAALVYEKVKIGNISASFSGIEMSSSAQVYLNESNNNYKCTTDSDLSTLENGSAISVTCTNKIFGFLNTKKILTISGLLTVNLPDKSLMTTALDDYLQKNYDLRIQIASGSLPVIILSSINEETGITQHLIYLTEDGTYIDFIVGNLYTRNGQPIQLQNGIENVDVEPGTIASNIQPIYLDGLVDLYLAQGYQKTGY